MYSFNKNRVVYFKSIFIILLFSSFTTLHQYSTANASDRGIGLIEKKTEVAQIPMGNFYAVLIGIDDYEHWPRLSSAVKDTKAVKDVLQTRYGFADNRIKRITNRDAIREGILESFILLNKKNNIKSQPFYATTSSKGKG